ncbi:NAD(P)/FAD-dependent oxidoreductase [Sinorhizobium mexicanum]|nr:FAD-dependent oxidoreductase [Sinorhizobium mexicanum]MBP1886484.1 glycine/D-amino acid oxidase-like deaminating enzyme [Sinorhizobium mexicanum]
MLHETDVAVIGGGLVGIAIAYGLANQKVSSIVLDEGDGAIRASRGNFGLVWVQGKGLLLKEYTPWAMKAAEYWPELAERLMSETSIDVGLMQTGGLFFCKTPEALAQRVADMAQVKAQFGGEYNYDILDNAGVRKMVPEIGHTIAGASYSDYDGQANPIRLLRAFHRAYGALGGTYLANNGVLGIRHVEGKFEVRTTDGIVRAQRIVLSAGLGNVKLGDMLGVEIPIRPMRGQIMVTERLPQMFGLAMEQVRQTDDGTLLIGTSWEDVGFDLSTTDETSRRIANDAIDFFPFLADVKIIRTWAALRILSPDASPIYDELVPGAFLVTCHSGVSLAAIHAFESAKWIVEGAVPQSMEAFGLKRFAKTKRPQLVA